MSDQQQAPGKRKPLEIKVPEEVARGAYANAMAVFHTREEFVLDFLGVFPPVGVAAARIITSPGHMKRIVRALEDNLRRYEEHFGKIAEAPPPYTGPMGYA
ncbi:MAG: DUF3467 domain-containing protein [bacterium]